MAAMATNEIDNSVAVDVFVVLVRAMCAYACCAMKNYPKTRHCTDISLAIINNMHTLVAWNSTFIHRQ